jgi:uncharacterized membrane protein
MTSTDKHPEGADHQVEVIAARLLRVGLALATALVVLGAGIYLARHATEQPRYEIFRGEPANLRSVKGILDWSVHWRGTGVIQLGLVILMATPIARVGYSVLAFAMKRDWLYVVIATIVLAIVLFGVLGSTL